MRKSFLNIGLCLVVFLLSGCPLLNQFLDAPESAFEGSPLTGEAPLTVLFTDRSEAGSVNITEWQWDFGDGTTSTLRNPSHIFVTPGRYSISLTVTSSVGTHTSLRRDYIEAVEKPEAQFSATPLAGGAPLTVSFADTSSAGSAPITAWEWNFGDRTPISTEQNPNHLYTTPGNYTVSLKVTTEAGSDTETKAQLVNVAGAPVTDFTSDVVSGVAPLVVKFTDTSATGTATLLSRTWDFGDGVQSTEERPAHTYETAGIYTVSLTVKTNAGEDQEVKSQFITVGRGPSAAFTGTPLSGPAPLSVAFTDASDPGTQAITRHQWDFGDGGLLSTLVNPARVYNKPGRYDVSLKVTSPAGTNTLLKPAYITVTPGVGFSATPTAGTGSVAVQFTDQSVLGSASVSARTWDFGDGTTSSEANPAHTYEAPGVYDVSLALTTELGPSAATRSALITVNPATEFTATPTSGLPPLNVTFKDETVPGALVLTGWNWNFGDGAAGTEQHPTHTYSVPGIYTVSLQTATARGIDTEQKAGLILVNPVVDFAAASLSGQGSLATSFQERSTLGNLNVLGWHWDFGDGESSTQRNPAHTYAAMGTYNVTLTVMTALGNQSTTKTGYIKVGPVVDFSADKVSGSGTLSVSFTDTSKPDDLEITSRLWAFGDGTTSTEQNPKHDFGPGRFIVSLTVTTAQGDTTTTRPDFIRVTPEVNIAAVQATGPAPFEASLLDLTQVGALTVTGWIWDLGDGTTSDEQNPVHVYEEPGKYTVTLTVLTDGGEFSRTNTDFITAQRGPTAAFSEHVIRGAAPEDPVEVSFTNLSLPGDSPLLNQTWDFGPSAIASEEAATEASPTVTYPGLLFDSVPQDVSLTVRTAIAENTLVKANLFGAPVSKSAQSARTLSRATLTATGTDASGDVWVAGTAVSPIVARLDGEGQVRWVVALESEEDLVFNAVCAPGDGTIYVAGTLGSGAWLARLDGAGEIVWVYRDAAPESNAGIGLAPCAEGGVWMAVRRLDTSGGYALHLMGLDGDGRFVASSPARLPVDDDGPIPLAVARDGAVLAMVADEMGSSTVFRWSTDENGLWLPVCTQAGLPVAVSAGDDKHGVLLAVSVVDDTSLVARSGDGGLVKVLSNVPGALAAIDSVGSAAHLIWLAREGVEGDWRVNREQILE